MTKMDTQQETHSLIVKYIHLKILFIEELLDMTNNLNWMKQDQDQNHIQQQNQYDDSILNTIVAKLGYTLDEVKKHLKEENSFVSVLYSKLLDENLNSSTKFSMNSNGNKLN